VPTGIKPAPEDDTAWAPYRDHWNIAPDAVYLNHGSFGPPPDVVRECQQQWKAELDSQPMRFFLRQMPDALLQARRKIASLVGAGCGNLVLIENSTYGMNIVANSFPLSAGDEVLLNDHEYGAVNRIWNRRCSQAGAHCVTAELPAAFDTAGNVVDAIFQSVTPRTRLIIISHITSPTAVTLPVAEVCAAAKDRGIAVCIDGAHAVAQLPVDIEALQCDFYTATCHKWLCAPFGTGFLYTAPQWQPVINPPVLSWGVIPPATPQDWTEEFNWLGTRDASAFLASTAAVDFLEGVGFEAFRGRTHHLAQYALDKLLPVTGIAPITPRTRTWCGSMSLAPLPPCDTKQVQNKLVELAGIETPVVELNGRCFIRVSCHLYTQRHEIDLLATTLEKVLRQ